MVEEERIKRLEEDYKELQKLISGMGGDLKLIIFRLDELVNRQVDLGSKGKECDERFVKNKEFSDKWQKEYRKEKSAKSKLVNGLILVVTAIIGSIVGVLSEIANLFK